LTGMPVASARNRLFGKDGTASKHKEVRARCETRGTLQQHF
jgi:hypothetical protein